MRFGTRAAPRRVWLLPADERHRRLIQRLAAARRKQPRIWRTKRQQLLLRADVGQEVSCVATQHGAHVFGVGAIDVDAEIARLARVGLIDPDERPGTAVAKVAPQEK